MAGVDDEATIKNDSPFAERSDDGAYGRCAGVRIRALGGIALIGWPPMALMPRPGTRGDPLVALGGPNHFFASYRFFRGPAEITGAS